MLPTRLPSLQRVLEETEAQNLDSSSTTITVKELSLLAGITWDDFGTGEQYLTQAAKNKAGSVDKEPTSDFAKEQMSKKEEKAIQDAKLPMEAIRLMADNDDLQMGRNKSRSFSPKLLRIIQKVSNAGAIKYEPLEFVLPGLVYSRPMPDPTAQDGFGWHMRLDQLDNQTGHMLPGRLRMRVPIAFDTRPEPPNLDDDE